MAKIITNVLNIIWEHFETYDSFTRSSNNWPEFTLRINSRFRSSVLAHSLIQRLTKLYC